MRKMYFLPPTLQALKWLPDANLQKDERARVE
jgi:hypothetical protein